MAKRPVGRYPQEFRRIGLPSTGKVLRWEVMGRIMHIFDSGWKKEDPPPPRFFHKDVNRLRLCAAICTRM